MKHVTVREYALLTVGDQESTSLDLNYISTTAFDYLCELAAGFRESGANLLQIAGRRSLKLDNYVGVIETPCGTLIEILPKHIDKVTDAEVPRKILCKMLATALDLPNREVGVADLELYRQPLHEWIIRQFLVALELLVSKGLRFDYQRVEEEQKFLRGQLDIAKKMRQPAGREHIFPIRYDVFTPDRAENRLLRAALDRICRVTQDPLNWRLAQELRLLTNQIPISREVHQDFKKWNKNRLLAHYQSIRPWCELILGQFMPVTVKGNFRGMSLLFPMEKLFESYVADCLRRDLVKGANLHTQAKSEYLCDHHTLGEDTVRKRFQLRPDLLVEKDSHKTVLDTKWKRLDASAYRYGLKDSDFQQMFAYSHFYLGFEGSVVLIYPYWESFQKSLPVFKFRKTEGKKLWVVPFDLDKDLLVLPQEEKGLLVFEWYSNVKNGVKVDYIK